jgi:TrmH family RNA methyltransferase
MTRITSVLEDQGVVGTARTRLAESADLTNGRRVLCLNGVQDPGNVGTLIRTAAWFGLDGILADTQTADFFNPKVVRAAAGALWDVKLVRSDHLVESLGWMKKQGFACFGADVRASDDVAWSEADKVVLVLGSEGQGLSEEVSTLMDGFVRVEGRRGPKHGVESLNVAAAGSILIAYWVEERPGSGR